jgi:hypothetical protein
MYYIKQTFLQCYLQEWWKLMEFKKSRTTHQKKNAEASTNWMSMVVTGLHRSSIHCIVLQGRRNNLCSRNSSWDRTYKTVWACTCLQHLHILPHCNCSQYPWSTGWWLPPQVQISTVTSCSNLKPIRSWENYFIQQHSAHRMDYTVSNETWWKDY